MAMNNWGGVKEHMSKKPRKFFGQKRVKRSFGANIKNPLSDEKLKESDEKRKSKIRKEMMICFLIAFVIAIGMIIYFQN